MSQRIIFLLVFLIFTRTQIFADDRKCQGAQSWTFIKAAGSAPRDFAGSKAKTRRFYLGTESLVWCNENNQYEGETDYFKMTPVQRAGTTVNIPLKFDDRGRKAGESISLSYNGTSATQESADSFVILINAKITEFNFNCSATPSWSMKKKGARSSKKHIRTVALGTNHLFWCEGAVVKGLIPFALMSRVRVNGKKKSQLSFLLLFEGGGQGTL